MPLNPARSSGILIRCDGTPRLGLGHVTRCLALAAALRDSFGRSICFASAEDGVGADMIRQQGFDPEIKPEGSDESDWLGTLIDRHSPDCLVLDIRTPLSADSLREYRNRGIVAAVIDDPSDRRKAADLAFYPPVPQIYEADWDGFDGEACIGWEYILLNQAFCRRGAHVDHPVPHILITMGGSDPGGLTLKALEALRPITLPYRAMVVLGRAFMHDGALQKLAPDLPDGIEFYRDVTDMPSLMEKADFAIAAFGNTAYELAALGVPSILLGLTPDHARSARALHQKGMAVSLGDHQHLHLAELTTTIETFMTDKSRRLSMRRACTPVDGLGAYRTAKRIVETIDLRHGAIA